VKAGFELAVITGSKTVLISVAFLDLFFLLLD
jgi:hypothetical protein